MPGGRETGVPLTAGVPAPQRPRELALLGPPASPRGGQACRRAGEAGWKGVVQQGSLPQMLPRVPPVRGLNGAHQSLPAFGGQRGRAVLISLLFQLLLTLGGPGSWEEPPLPKPTVSQHHRPSLCVPSRPAPGSEESPRGCRTVSGFSSARDRNLMQPPSPTRGSFTHCEC